MAIDTIWFVVGAYALAAIVIGLAITFYFRR